jgi:hypothetical protein
MTDPTREHLLRSTRTATGRAAKHGSAERRATERQAAEGRVLVSPGHEGALVDWSVRGFAVESNRTVRVGGTYRLRWWLGEASRPLAGIARWSRLLRTNNDPEGDVTPVFRTGFELVRLPTSDQTGVN